MLQDELVFKNISHLGNQVRLTLTEFSALCIEFGKADSSFREQHQEVFIQIPLKSWVAKLHDVKNAAHVQDTRSVGQYIKIFNQHYGETIKGVDSREEPNNVLIKVLLAESPNKPNNL